MGWRGVMDVMWGEDVTCQHGNYTNDVMGLWVGESWVTG
jgi:hypothetical protein